MNTNQQNRWKPAIALLAALSLATSAMAQSYGYGSYQSQPYSQPSYSSGQSTQPELSLEETLTMGAVLLGAAILGAIFSPEPDGKVVTRDANGRKISTQEFYFYDH